MFNLGHFVWLAAPIPVSSELFFYFRSFNIYILQYRMQKEDLRDEYIKPKA